MKTNLLSNVSHELRTPLVAVMGYTDMLYNGKVGAINDTQREYLGIILRNVEKLVTLIENLLDFSRLHRGKKRLVFCDSRSYTEQLRNLLRGHGVRTFVSHASLSAVERRQAETAFAEEKDCVIVATSTLEL
ncbi:MAG TPA: histidine kinase dimerization/phospho-acceptor domain-containing protein, partial [Candidatus Hydrogenedentes bacterium]|nr:histidine kinase dimerization/phospho-acceptor domain-containing protein [Candidatus Hydrogenedentota bacterium]